MAISKSSIDKAGRILAGKDSNSSDRAEAEAVLSDFRKRHLEPLTDLTLDLQNWLNDSSTNFLLAQRLKRKPQIIKKLGRLSVRLSQLQDIGGCRIIVENNLDVERILNFLKTKIEKERTKILTTTDYRSKGRDDSGYRAVHVIFERESVKLELQVRSRIQHYWAESIERTSVVYGHSLKELEGAEEVVEYFKLLSNLFYEIESGRRPSTPDKLELAGLRDTAERLIRESDQKRVFDSYVNEGIVKTLTQKEKSLGAGNHNHWLIIFNWNIGAFVEWSVVVNDPDTAIQRYAEKETQYPAEEGFEVVLLGSSSVSTIRETHSHYFGIDRHNEVLESLDESVLGFSRKMDIDVGARQILAVMHRKNCWGKKTVHIKLLKNHFCQDVITFDSSLEALQKKGLIGERSAGNISLSLQKKELIEGYL
jgi:ppGpp synthetase/RelA/SpoT-type nucleotidyltranferase